MYKNIIYVVFFSIYSLVPTRFYSESTFRYAQSDKLGPRKCVIKLLVTYCTNK